MIYKSPALMLLAVGRDTADILGWEGNVINLIFYSLLIYFDGYMF